MARPKKVSKYTRESISNLLATNDRAVARALLVLFKRQTTAERTTNSTHVWNERGFTGADAHWGCINAKLVLRTGYLTPRQLAYWRQRNRRGVMRIAKYHRQLIEEAEARDAEKQARLPLAA